jgi:hypothetical protein
MFDRSRTRFQHKDRKSYGPAASEMDKLYRYDNELLSYR